MRAEAVQWGQRPCSGGRDRTAKAERKPYGVVAFMMAELASCSVAFCGVLPGEPPSHRVRLQRVLLFLPYHLLLPGVHVVVSDIRITWLGYK